MEIIVFDNTIVPNEIIREVIGERHFGDVTVKRKILKDIYRQNIQKIFPDSKWYEVNSAYDEEKLLSKLSGMTSEENIKILHVFSDHIISDVEKASLSLKKLNYITEKLLLKNGNYPAGIMFSSLNEYNPFLKKIIDSRNISEYIEENPISQLSTEGLVYIGEINNFITCITGNFDSRYFNSLVGTEYIIRKSSTNKKKIKSEYKYYHLLPEKMQHWFVMPFDYQEDDDRASYAMEHLYMTDVAIKWVHGSITPAEFSKLMDMYFTFFKDRNTKNVSKEEYQKISDTLYLKKVEERLDDLVKLEKYSKIEHLLKNSGSFSSIQEVFAKYKELKSKVESRTHFECVSAIGHGDPCFANTMYNRATRTLKLIDPKGALCEEELWTNPYYDIAKLSHSVCGNYDFFNNAMFDISIDENFEYNLSIPFDNSEYKEIFRKKVEENGFDYWVVRIYEASLFISMLPLHIDYPHKVFGFILNAINILKEIEENV